MQILKLNISILYKIIDVSRAHINPTIIQLNIIIENRFNLELLIGYVGNFFHVGTYWHSIPDWILWLGGRIKFVKCTNIKYLRTLQDYKLNGLPI